MAFRINRLELGENWPSTVNLGLGSERSEEFGGAPERAEQEQKPLLLERVDK